MKLYMSRTVPLSIIRSFSLYTALGWNILILLESCLQTCMTYTFAVCTVKNSWWWTEELSETCKVSLQNKFEKLVHQVAFIIRICHDARSHESKIMRDVSPAGDLQTYLLHILRKMLLLGRKYQYHYTLLCSNIVTSDDDSHDIVLHSLPPAFLQCNVSPRAVSVQCVGSATFFPGVVEVINRFILL